MNKILQLLSIVFVVFLNAQEKNIYQRLEKIYTDYNDSCSVQKNKILGDYKKIEKIKNPDDTFLKKYEADTEIYYEKVKILKSSKIEKLRNLLEEVENQNPIVSKKILFVPKDANTTNEKIQEYVISIFGKNSDIEIIKADNAEFEKIIISYKTQTEYLRKNIAELFPTEYFESGDYSELRTVVRFYLDSDGKLKKIKAYGENEEYNLVTSLLLYLIDKNFEKYIYNGHDVLIPFRIPVTMRFE